MSPRVFAFEQERFFAGSWTCVGREGDLRGPGRSGRCGSGGRGAAGPGDRRAGAGVRQHLPAPGPRAARGGRADDPADRPLPLPRLDLRPDGSLRAAPGFRDHGDFRPASTGWSSCRWRAGTGSCSSTAPATPRRSPSTSGPSASWSPYQPERLIPWSATPTTWPATGRWCSRTTTSATTARSSTPSCARSARRPAATTSSWTAPGSAAPWTSRTTRPPCRWTATATACPRAGRERLRTVAYLGLFPNLLLSLHPDYVMTHLVEPLGPDLSHVVCTWYFPPEAAERPGFDPSYAVEFWDRTNRQDWAACESVQRGMASPTSSRAARPGRGRRLPRGDDDRPRLPGRAPQRSPRDDGTARTQEPSPVR